ncbi:hypothetical protein [Deinococcus cellulosilyticus]|uniref:Uncharacterized protein n=1 Tax=Deinococcus cellulosilyticus (strain DSM 18568 / NBRC 106333 / KACC 11606 / 5516J-15) TaxID=1223518 RepID=A0A511N9S7_DEIC1|nr:hypothetical protein [Deinococcus cellulosilyticus]GEM49248.1 hypothetical protein DC3_48830 [Deinococcus cellulosilyticus NBRC 106333 = KACC 11606]
MKHSALALLSLTGLLLAACSTGGNTPPPGPTTVQVSGKLLAPDGSTPIANALVYIENSTVAAIQAQALACGTPPNATWAATCTGPDGAFTLKGTVNTAKFTMKFQKGSFVGIREITSSSGPINVGNVNLDNTQGAPKMAVVTGSYDQIEDVLAKLGFGTVENGQLKPGTEKFTLFDGNGSLPDSYREIEALFTDGNDAGTQADIFNYDIVFFNCGTRELLENAQMQILRDYVQGGGKIYASDLAYDYVEQAFPEFVNFYGSDSTPAAEKEGIASAQVGTSGITSETTVDDNLKAWLQGVSCTGGSCVQANGKVHIEGFLFGWAVINGPHPEKTSVVKTWVHGPVNWMGSPGGQPEDKPLSVTFPFGNGKVLYTSYHTEPAASETLLPQERILQYLVFEL